MHVHVFQEKSGLSDENWPALCEVAEPAGSIPKKGPMKPTPSQTSGNQSNSDSGGDDSSKENKENGSTTSENGHRTPKKKGIYIYI